MPKASTALAGVILVTALTYQSRINLISQTAQVQKEIDHIKDRNDSITRKSHEPHTRLSLQRPLSPVERFVDNTSLYYNARLVPSVKESWNAQVMQFTFALIQSDLPRRCSQFVKENIFGKQDTIQ
ncbi:hypothetical protein BD560DRAFT_440716 [Blakeslea trispora]|nr:hypothetical protein BD560DRAFT_440716 [Blakeslea trispora]